MALALQNALAIQEDVDVSDVLEPVEQLVTAAKDTDSEQLEAAFSEFMARYAPKPVSTPTPVSVEVASQVAKTTGSSGASTADSNRASQDRAKLRESLDAVRQMRDVANEITRSVLDSHRYTAAARRIYADIALGLLTSAGSFGFATLSVETLSPSFVLALALYVVSVLMAFRISVNVRGFEAMVAEENGILDAL